MYGKEGFYLLALQNVCVSYGTKQILTNINLQLQNHKIYAILGKSGCGKSTLLQTLAGIQPYTGSITLQNKKLDSRRHRIAFIPQKNSLIPWQTVEQNIRMPFSLRQLPQPQHLENLCQELGIHTLLLKYPNHISGGEQQRVAIARAFLFTPDLLLMDEAFSALDAITKEEVHHIFAATIAKHKVSTLFVTHDISEALYLAEEIYVLRDGKLQKPFDKNELFGQDKEDFPIEYQAMIRFYKEQI